MTIDAGWTFAAIDHVQLAMPVGQEEAAEAFYRDVLGLTVVAKPPALAVRGGRWFEQGAVRIHLGAEEGFRPARKAHPALVVSPFRALLARLDAAGVELTWAEEGPGVRRGHIDDCFGNRLELVDPGDGDPEDGDPVTSTPKVAMDSCPDCGFEYHEDQAPLAAAAIVDGSDWVARAIESEPGRVADRPDPQTWSPVEYACHLRDVLLVQRERVILARSADTPSLTPMAREERVVFDGYADQSPIDVGRQLRDAARMFVNVLMRLDDSAWERTVIYNYPEPRERTLRWVAVHTQHEVHHHRRDISLQLPGT